MSTKKFILTEQDIPTAWYNIVADMTNKPIPSLVGRQQNMVLNIGTLTI